MKQETTLRVTVDSWAYIVIDKWLERIEKEDIGYTHYLREDLKYELQGSGDTPQSVGFSFPYYGKFVDMGVGKGVKLEDVKSGRLERLAGMGGHRRRAKKWYSRTFYAQFQRLGEILAAKYGRLANLAIHENLDDNALRWTPHNR